VAEQVLGGEPVIKVASLGPALIDPEQVGGVLDLDFGRSVGRVGGGAHAGRRVGVILY
jgi:hypothetical protein